MGTPCHFALFELQPSFRLDLEQLATRYRELARGVHPDRFADASEREQRLALEQSASLNEAYQTLKKPLPRARYLLHLSDHDVGSENNVLMPTDFLIEQMEWREAVGEARAAGEHHELEHLHHRLQHDIAQRYDELAALFDDAHDLEQAADRVRRLMFIEKLLVELDEAMIACEE